MAAVGRYYGAVAAEWRAPVPSKTRGGDRQEESVQNPSKKYRDELLRTIKVLRTELDELRKWLRNEAYFGEAFLTDPSAAGLTSLLGKVRKSHRIGERMTEVEQALRDSSLSAREFYRISSPLLRDLVERAKTDRRRLEKMVTAAKRPQTRRERRVDAYYAAVLQAMLETFVEHMREIFREKKKKEQAQRGLCGAPCSSKDMTCTRVVLDGGRCWQHVR